MTLDSIQVEWLGRLDYSVGLESQRQRQYDVATDAAAEAFWMLEHHPVLTTGRRAVPDLDPTTFEKRGIPVFETERGGLATWHGPGQLVGYPILNLHRRGISVKDYVAGLQIGLCRWLSVQGVLASRRDGLPGVWVGNAKIAAVGVNVRRGVSMHGFALNLCPDLTVFDSFTPCGIEGAGVTSVLDQTGIKLQPVDVANDVGCAVLAALWGNTLIAA